MLLSFELESQKGNLCRGNSSRLHLEVQDNCNLSAFQEPGDREDCVLDMDYSSANGRSMMGEPAKRERLDIAS